MKEVIAGRSVHVSRLIPAARDQVFAAWAESDLLARWFAPPGLVATVDVLDFEPGGRYRITMRGDEGASHTVQGVFTEVDPPQRLRMSWSWEAEPEEISQVTVDFLDRAAGTEILVHHERLSEESAAAHREGWTACLANLQQLATEWPS